MDQSWLAAFLRGIRLQAGLTLGTGTFRPDPVGGADRGRVTKGVTAMARSTGITIPQHVGEAAEINYSGQAAADYGPLARDRIPVRSMAEGDLHAMVGIDRRITGRDRVEYFQRKLAD